MIDSKISWFKVLSWILIFTFCAVVWIFAVSKIEGCINKRDVTETETLYIHDTSIVERVITNTDTVIKWYEKIIYKQTVADVVYFQKVDTIFLKQAAKLDLVMKLVKKGDRVDAYTINFNDTLLKQSIFTNVGNDFSLTSQAGKVFVKSKLFYWNGLSAYISYGGTLDKNLFTKFYPQSIRPGIKTGWNYMDKFHTDILLSYNISELNFNTELNLSYKFLK